MGLFDYYRPALLGTHTLAMRWWAFGLRSACYFVIAFFSMANLQLKGKFALPVALTLGHAFGYLAVVTGILVIISATGRPQYNWEREHVGFKERGTLLGEGVIGIVAGVVALLWPDMSSWILRVLISLYAILSGVLASGAGGLSNRGLEKGGCYMFGAFLSIVFGVSFAIWGTGHTAGWLFIAFTGVQGICLLAVTMGLKKFNDNFCKRY